MRGWGPQRNAAAPTFGVQSGSAALGGAGLVVRLTVWLPDCWQPPPWVGSQDQRLDCPGQAGCQGEVGSASSMATDGVAEVLGGRLTQVENAARMALWGEGRHAVGLDTVIETMRQTGEDMLAKYKETSRGGLAVNVVEC